MDLVDLRLMDGEDGTAVRLPEQLGVLEEMRPKGGLGLIGVSNADVEGLQVALGLVDVGEVQSPYSIRDRSGEAVLERCRERSSGSCRASRHGRLHRVHGAAAAAAIVMGCHASQTSAAARRS